jgi:hypothetical protein
MDPLMSAAIGFGSALLAIFLTPVLQHYFWRRQRHAELSLATIKRCAKLIEQLSDRLLVIRGTKKRSEADNDILLRWEAMWLEIRSLFSTATQAKFSRLNQLIVEFSNPLGDGGFRISDFDSARIGALTALYEEIGLTGDQISNARWWQIWRM